MRDSNSILILNLNINRLILLGFSRRPEVAARNSVSFNLPPTAAGRGNAAGGVGGSGAVADFRQMYDTLSDVQNSFQKHVNNNNSR